MNPIDITLTQSSTALRENRPQDARRYCDEAVAMTRVRDDKLELAYVLRHTANILSKLGSYDIAATQIEEAIHIYRNTADSKSLDLANALRIFALNEERRLLNIWAEAKDIYAFLCVQAGVDEALHHMQQLSASLMPENPQ